MPTVIVAVLLRGIDALKTFDILYATKGKGGGSFHEVETLNVYAYGLSFDYNEYGVSSAVLILFFLIIIGSMWAAHHPQESGKQMTVCPNRTAARRRPPAPAPRKPLGTRAYKVFRVAPGAVVLFLLAPLFWMVLASLKTNVDIYDTGKAFVFTPTCDNYANVLQQANYFVVHLQQLLGGLRLHRAVAPPRRPRGLRDEPLHDAPLGPGGADGPRHPRRVAAGALVLRLLQPEDGRRLRGADPQPHVRRRCR